MGRNLLAVVVEGGMVQSITGTNMLPDVHTFVIDYDTDGVTAEEQAELVTVRQPDGTTRLARVDAVKLIPAEINLDAIGRAVFGAEYESASGRAGGLGPGELRKLRDVAVASLVSKATGLDVNPAIVIKHLVGWLVDRMTPSEQLQEISGNLPVENAGATRRGCSCDD